MSDEARGGWRRYLFNPAEGRLRAGWRLVLVLPVQVLALLAGGLVFATVLAAAPSEGPLASVGLTLGGLGIYGAMGVAVLAMARWFDRRPWNAWLTGSRWWRDVAVGLVIGLGMGTMAVVGGLVLGAYRITGTLVTDEGASLVPAPEMAVTIGDTHALVVVALLFVLHVGVGVSEELLVRGYLLTNLAEGMGGVGRVGRRGAIAFAAVATSLLFGALHLSNPNVGGIATANIVLAGLLFAGTYVATGSLGLAIGAHITWNFALAGLYGLPVSGLDSPGSLLAVEAVGDSTVTGGAFGPEAGLVFYPALAVGLLASAAWIQYSRGGLALKPSIATYSPPEPAEEGEMSGTS